MYAVDRLHVGQGHYEELAGEDWRGWDVDEVVKRVSCVHWIDSFERSMGIHGMFLQYNYSSGHISEQSEFS